MFDGVGDDHDEKLLEDEPECRFPQGADLFDDGHDFENQISHLMSTLDQTENTGNYPFDIDFLDDCTDNPVHDGFQEKGKSQRLSLGWDDDKISPRVRNGKIAAVESDIKNFFNDNTLDEEVLDGFEYPLSKSAAKIPDPSEVLLEIDVNPISSNQDPESTSYPGKLALHTAKILPVEQPGIDLPIAYSLIPNNIMPHLKKLFISNSDIESIASKLCIYDQVLNI